MPMTAQQIVDLRGDMSEFQEAFSDAELHRYWDRTSGAADEYTHLKAVKALMLESLLNGSAKLHDYTAGATQEKLSQIVANLEKRLKAYEPALEAAMGQKVGLSVAALRSYPHQERVEPSENGEADDWWQGRNP